MTASVARGVVAGLAAGVLFGLIMTFLWVPTPEGGQTRMMTMVAMILRSDSLSFGWLYHLFNSAIIGGLFALMFGPLVRSYPTALGWGTLYGFGWWVLGGLILMPLFLGMPAFAPLADAAMRSSAAGSLLGHLVFGLALGPVFHALRQTRIELPVG